MDGTKIILQRDRRIGQLNGRHENNSSKGWMAQKTRQREGRVESYMVDIKITRQRMEN